MTNTFLRDDATFAQVSSSISGTTTNDNASAGNLGEFSSNTTVSGSALALTTDTAKTITSISLTPGDWEVRGVVHLKGAPATTVAYYGSSISTTTNGIDQSDNMAFAFTPNHNQTPFNFVSIISSVTPTRRASLTTTTSYFLTTQVGFGTSTCSGYGSLTARRVR